MGGVGGQARGQDGRVVVGMVLVAGVNPAVRGVQAETEKRGGVLVNQGERSQQTVVLRICAVF